MNMPSRNSVLIFSNVYLTSSSTSILPFLYQTRTLKSQLLSRDEKQIIHRCRAHRSFCLTALNHTIPFEHSVSSTTTAKESSYRDGSRKSDFRRLNLSRFTNPATKGDLQFSPSHTTASALINSHSTLTASEKAVFDKIFKDIAHSKAEEASFKDEFGDEFSPEFGDEFAGEVTEEIDKMFENAIERQSLLEENRAAALSIAPQSPEAMRLDSLRESHEKAFTKKLQSAQTDIEVWTLLEKELFWLFRPLKKRDKDTKTSDPAPSVKKGKAPKRERKKGTDNTTTEEVVGESEDLLSVIQKNYGEYCLSALRLLRREFPSSPYVLRLLPTIKQFGHISYVLGASTALYNEILFVKWTQYSDLDGIADLVNEMLHKGVDVNEVSINLLVAVAKERQRALSADGDVDQATKAWWRLSGVQESWNRVRLWLDASIQDLRRRRVSEEREQMNDEDKDNVDGAAAEVALREDSVEQGGVCDGDHHSAQSPAKGRASRAFHMLEKPSVLVRYREA